MISRARNRDNMYYHAVCSIFSNGIWFASMGILVENDLSWDIAPFYIAGTIVGSLLGAKISMRIEKLIGAKV